MRSRLNNIDLLKDICFKDTVSTHSRPKAAVNLMEWLGLSDSVSTHSHPKAAGKRHLQPLFAKVSTHSRPKAAGRPIPQTAAPCWFQHTAARRRLGLIDSRVETLGTFQHTAARRRLERHQIGGVCPRRVSTHSRLKATGAITEDDFKPDIVSTHSRLKATGFPFAI